jgi:hypothetical protein
LKKQTLKKFGRVGCIALAGVFALSAPGAAFASAASTRKDETVYVNLDQTGNAQSTIVSDWLHAGNGSQRITDRSDLTNIQNVKTNESAIRSGDSLSWVLGTDNTGKNIYYQGTTEKKTPLAVTIAYTLDGKPVTAEEIAGKSGKVRITLTIKNTASQTVDVRGKSVTMDTPMTAFVAATLPSDTFKNVAISSGKMLTDGNNQFVVFLTMPGLSDSLGLKSCGFPELSGLDFPETLTITADAVKFHLPSIAVAATPKLIDSDKLASSDDISKLTANLSKLKSIQSNIQSADPQKNLSSLFTNPDRTAAARLLVDDVFDFYSLDTSALDILPKYVNDGSIRLCDRVTSDLDKADLKYLIDNNVLSAAAGSLSNFDAKKAQTLMNDYAALGTFDTSKLNGVKKVLNDYSKVGGGLTGILNDTGNLLNHTNTGSLATLGALGSTDVQNSLSGTFNSMSSLSGALSSYGISSVQFDQSDITALLTSYVSRNFSTLAAQAIGKNSTNGCISVKSLAAVLQGLGVDSKQQAALLQTLGAALGKSLDQNSMIPDTAVEQMLASLPAGTQQAMAAALAGSLAQKLTPSVNGLLSSSGNLQAALKNELGSDYASELTSAMSSLNAEKPYLDALGNDLGKISKEKQGDINNCLQEAEALLSNKSDLDYLASWARKLEGMKADLNGNRGNIAILTNLMKTAGNPKVKAFGATLPTLQTDLTGVYSVSRPLLNALNQPEIRASMRQLPATANTLLKIEKDVNGSREIMNIFRQATDPATVSLFRNTLDSLDSLQKDSLATNLTAKLDSAEDLLARKDAYVKLADRNSIFTEAADGASTELKFIYKTAEIKEPAAQPAPVKAAASTQKSQSGGFWGWLKSLFHR